MFDRAARLPNGRYRVLASRFAPGRPLGNFRYYGTRPDDPNDIVAHEHRRELRAARVFGAWLNHDDSRGINSLDMLETTTAAPGSSTTCSTSARFSAAARCTRSGTAPGNEYLFEQQAWLADALHPRLLPPALDDASTIRMFRDRSAGSRPSFDPLDVEARISQSRVREHAAGRRVLGSADCVEVYRRDDPRRRREGAVLATRRPPSYMTQTLITRRDKVVAAWSIRCVRLSIRPGADGTLVFGNAAVDARRRDPPREYTLQWFALRQRRRLAAGRRRAVQTSTPGGRAPAGVLDGADFVGVRISASHPQHPQWSSPATFLFRRTAGGWELVGVER